MNLRAKIVWLIEVVVASMALLSLALVSAVYAYGPTKGWYNRVFRTPPILRASFVEAFDKLQGQAQRERFSAASVASCEEPTDFRAGIGLDLAVKNSNQPVHRTGAQRFCFGCAGKTVPWLRGQFPGSGSSR
jgi:hypothetical protein